MFRRQQLEGEGQHIVAVSGGKDSTAMALRLREIHPDREYIWVCTPTGNEPDSMQEHWSYMEDQLGGPIVRIKNPHGGLIELSTRQGILPHTRMRWCTRMLKVEPYLGWLRSNKFNHAISYVGLRADEEAREGIYGETGIAEYRYPLRDWGWGIGDVIAYLFRRGVEIPERTDCELCPFQRLHEWHALWSSNPQGYQAGVSLERHVSEVRGQQLSIRSPSRDTQPNGLAELGEKFSRGYVPSRRREDDKHRKCRVCSL